MTHLGLFEGIGGFSLAARWMGWKTVAWCEWNEFGQRVLRHHFPDAEGYGDIKKTNFEKYAGKIDILTGGFPCQPYSNAGKRKGKADERHLWPEMLRAIREISPRYVVGENVRGFTNWNGGMVFDEVQADLEAQGYEVLPFLLPACAVNAPHRRDRIWFVAYRNLAPAKHKASTRGNVSAGDDKIITHSDSNGLNRSDSKHEINTGEGGVDALNDSEQAPLTDTKGRRKGRLRHQSQETRPREGDELPGGQHRIPTRSESAWQDFPTQPPVCSGDDGLSDRLDGITFSKWRNESIKAYGNAIVPQVAYEIFKAIQQYENT